MSKSGTLPDGLHARCTRTPRGQLWIAWSLPPISLLPTLESQHFSRFYALENQVLSIIF